MGLCAQHKTEFYKKVGWQLRSIRQLRGMSLEALADRLDKSYQTVQKYEDGKISLPSNILSECSKIFDVPVGYFYAEDDALIIDSFDKTVFRIAREMVDLPKDVRTQAYQFIQSIKKSYNIDQNKVT